MLGFFVFTSIPDGMRPDCESHVADSRNAT